MAPARHVSASAPENSRGEGGRRESWSWNKQGGVSASACENSCGEGEEERGQREAEDGQELDEREDDNEQGEAGQQHHQQEEIGRRLAGAHRQGIGPLPR